MMFTDDAEAAFANLKFWQSLGNTIISIFGGYLALNFKAPLFLRLYSILL